MRRLCCELGHHKWQINVAVTRGDDVLQVGLKCKYCPQEIVASWPREHRRHGH